MKGGVSSEAEPPTKKQRKLRHTMSLKLLQRERVLARRKFDSRLEAYELDQNRPLMDQKTIDDSVKSLLEERLKVLGVGKIPENNDNPFPLSAYKSLTLASPRVQTQQNSVNSPALAATPGKVFRPKKNLAKELDKESGVKRTLAEEFGSVAKATDLDSQHVDFVLISPSKATKDDKDAKVPAYGRGCRGKRIVQGEEADEKKKAAQADAAFKKKEKAEAKKKRLRLREKRLRLRKKMLRLRKKRMKLRKKEAEGKKTEAELKKKQGAELKKQKHAESKNKEVTPSGEDSVFADVTDKTTFERGKRNAESILRHLFKWADECLVEEVEDIKSLISGMNKDISEFRLNVDRLEKEIEVMKTVSEGKGEECMSKGGV
ncbi:hypothetical protein HID58_041009 [Brassica napus]|uniref:Uncharacterized protein n=1 Tax=Brassica napus TaxID=3708 RepID=A0ABQ8BB92_BRANA|nr:hypothetical protein HID58_041009 [Brassica napus]